jgi:hypothetical protein
MTKEIPRRNWNDHRAGVFSGSVERGSAEMSLIVFISFCCTVFSGAVGLEWAALSGVAFSIAAVSATVFFAGVDAWEAQIDKQEIEEG